MTYLEDGGEVQGMRGIVVFSSNQFQAEHHRDHQRGKQQHGQQHIPKNKGGREVGR